MYHVPSLKKLIREPKNGNRIMAGPAPDTDAVYISTGHWLLRLQVPELPAALVGFLPRADEPEGYSWDSTCRTAPGPAFSQVVPADRSKGDTLILAPGTLELKQRAGDVDCRLLRTEHGRNVFVDNAYWAVISKAFHNLDLEYTQSGDCCPVCAWATDGALAFLLMPMRVDESDISFPTASTIGEVR